MISFFKKTGARRQAIRDGKLIDMHKKPFGRINKDLGIDYSVAMTPAAFQQFIALSESPAHREMTVELRWVTLLGSLVEHHQNSEATEGIWELNVLESDGTLRAKAIKVVIEPDDQGKESFTFMLPEESALPVTLQ